MKIAGVSAAFPSRKVSNQEVLDLIKQQSPDFDGDIDRAIRRIGLSLKYIGIKERRWLGEKDFAFDYTEAAINKALDQAGLAADSIDLLIFTSVDKRVAEPGMSFFIAKAMGMNCECFDITEGCGGWVRSTRIAQAYLNAGIYKNVLIVTAEYTNHEGEPLFSNFSLNNVEELDWAFASYTVGEGSTATILNKDDEDWYYENISKPEWADLCMAPLDEDNPQVLQMNEVSMEGKGKYRFVSYSQKMHELSFDLVQDMVLNNRALVADEVDLFIPHTQTLTVWKDLEKTLGYKLPYIYLLPEYGNLVNNSMAAGLSVALEQGRLKRGDNVSGLMTAAGMSFTLFNFNY